ncbi:carboxypeptidase-like regulatory domain-containing protein [Aquimarina pacifica]|uniref:carboxypeptidase-like regulatory domain-containing protein n=1 Tax=Aquimarina pacifica TaxID=1296415 RepID=UPI000470F8DA|nr:carboxypeptidase-like regulatory domain-containing protein [Aquimarina pacifica]
MKTILFYKKHTFLTLFILINILTYTETISAFTYIQDDIAESSINHTEYNGIVIDKASLKPLKSASISLIGTNVSTVTNDEGEFLLKVPQSVDNGEIRISHLGYKDASVKLSEFKDEKLTITLSLSVTELSEVMIDRKDPYELIKAVMKKKGDNYINDNTIMTAFYRETIKKRRSYVSLSEAVIDVYKNPYISVKNDIVKLFKARKSADYKKLDTITLKLQGGPTSTLYIDVMKNPEILFTENMTEVYEFSFDQATTINDRYIYVLKFKQRPSIIDPLYYGKLYIDSKTLAMTKAIFSLNMENKEEVSKMFVRKKPQKAKVHLTEASYNIDYREKNGKWYYGYGRIDLGVKINWKKKLFNSLYKLNVEMAITDWKKNNTNETLRPKDRLKSSIVLSDEASGFSDPEFWGAYNVIEPEKSIESAIKKIKKQLRKLN